MLVNSISGFNSKIQQYNNFKNSENQIQSYGSGSSLMQDSDYYKERIKQEEKKIGVLTRFSAGLGLIGIAVSCAYFISSFKKPGGNKNLKHAVKEIAPEFKSFKNDSSIPTIETCNSLEDGLKEFLNSQLLIYNSEAEIVKASGAKPTARIILNGEPGVGKSYFAKIFAKSTDAEYMEVKVPDIISMWAGEGVQNINGIFDSISKHAEKNSGKRFVVVLNEIDSYIQPVGQYGHDRGTRWVSKMEERGAFINAIDMLQEKNPNVTIIGTTNIHPKNIDGASKSRFSIFNVKRPNRRALNEAIKSNFNNFSYGKEFITNNESDIAMIAQKMEEKKYSFRDMEKVINTSTNYYLEDKVKDKNAVYKFDYLKKAFEKYEFTDGVVS